MIEKIRDSVVSIYERLHSTKLGPDLKEPPSSTAIDLDNDSVVDILDRLRERTSALHKLVCFFALLLSFNISYFRFSKKRKQKSPNVLTARMRAKMKDVTKCSKRQSLAKRFLEILSWRQ